MRKSESRRSFIKLAGLSALLGPVTLFSKGYRIKEAKPAEAAVNSAVSLGIATYSLRHFPLAEAITIVKRTGLKRISLKEVHLPLTSSAEAIRKASAEIKDAGLDLYALGVIYMTSETEVDRAFQYAKTAGVKMIVGVPEYGLLDYTERKVKEFDIRVAVHNHGPQDKRYPSPAEVYERIKTRDERMGLCLDIGHTMRLGIDPAVPAEKYKDRLFDIHVKDESAASAEGSTIEMGHGVIDLPNFIKTLIKINYKGTCAVEFEKDEKDPVPGLSESIGYFKGILSAI